MKHLVTFLFVIVLAQQLSAQQSQLDTSLHFDQKYTKCERKWVVLVPRDTSKSYNFGFIYIDEQAGFTYDLQGVFRVSDQNKYIRDTNIFKQTGSIKYRIAPNWQRVALLPEKHFAELGIKPQPDWIKFHYTYADTLAHNYRWGWIYNDLDECEIALNYLEQAYRINQHAKGVEFEMAYAYNALNRFDDAIRILDPALQNDSTNMFYYKELGYAYQHKKEFEKAIVTYKQGLAHAPVQQSASKGELAFNMANAYKALGNNDDYKKWMTVAKEYTPTNSPNYKAIIDAGF